MNAIEPPSVGVAPAATSRPVPPVKSAQAIRGRPAETADPVADATTVLRWAALRFGDRACVTSSFADGILAHLANEVVPGVEIALIDTGYLFAETEWYADDLAHRFGLNLRILRPVGELAPNVWQRDTTACCAARKVEPLRRHLANRDAWVTGVRRTDSVERRRTPFVAHDSGHDVVKINPLAAWTDADVADYAARHRIPDHPLADRGYSSIGCWPCTRPVLDGDDPRAGRWADSAKTECGLHLA